MNLKICHLKIDVLCEVSVTFHHISQNATPATEPARCHHFTQPWQWDGRLQTVANDCQRKRNVERTHPQPPDPQSGPQSETRTLATHSAIVIMNKIEKDRHGLAPCLKPDWSGRSLHHRNHRLVLLSLLPRWLLGAALRYYCRLPSPVHQHSAGAWSCTAICSVISHDFPSLPYSNIPGSARIW